MSRFSYKSLLIIFFFLLIGIIVLWKFVLPNNKVSAAWWNDSWLYRKAISISNTSGSNLTDFQVSLSVGTSALIASGKMQSDCDDIRITDINGNLLPYWIEENNPGCNQATDTKIWVKASSLPTSGSTVYLYYGNTSATSIQNGNNVFEFFDDFSTNLNKWANSNTDCQASISSGVLNIPAGAGTCDGYPLIAPNLNLSDTPGYIMEVRGKFSSGGNGRLQIYQRRRNNNGYMGRFWISGSSNTYYQEFTPNSGANTNVGANNMSADTWYNLKTQVNGSNNTFYINDTAIGSTTSSASVTPFTDLTIGLGQYLTTVQFDNVRVRKYASADPIPTLQSEELSPAPIAYWKFDEGIGTTAYDSSGQNNTGTFLSAPIWKNESECVSGKCLAFDNVDDGVSIANKNFVGLTDYTMSSWINLKGNHKNYEGTIMSSGNWNTQWWSFGINQANTAIFMYGYASKAFNFQLNKWTYVTVTRIGGQYNFYVDGKSIGNYSGSSSPLVSDATNTTIGRETYAGGYFDFNGWIDEPKIYPYARTAAQIKQDYNSGKSHASTKKGSSVNLGNSNKSGEFLSDGLVGYWKMDEGIGTTTADSSGNNYTGTLTNVGWISGKYGIGTSFNGSNTYTTFPSIVGNDTSFSVSGWIKLNADQISRTIFSNQTSDSNSWVIGISDSTTNILKFYLGSAHLYAVTPLVNGTWNHFTVTYDNGNPKIYINGQLNNSSTGTIVASGTYLNNAIGCLYRSGGCAGQYFNGSIDELRVYNRALSPSEVSQLYNWDPGVSSLKKPIAYYKFDEGVGTTVYDSSPNKTNGVLQTGTSIPTWSADGKINKALNFLGNDNSYVSINDTGTSSPIDLTNEFTISGWFNIKNFNNYDSILFKYVVYAILPFPDGSLRFFAYNDSWGEKIKSKSIISTNKWTHFTITYSTSNTKLKIYINGKLDNETTVSTPVSVNNNPLYVGRGYNGENGSMNGLIDELKIYNSALSADEVKQDYNRGSAIQFGSTNQTIGATTTSLEYCIPGDTSYCASPIAEYKMDEKTGTVVNDTSGNNNNGTFGTGNSAPTWTQGKIGSGVKLDGVNDYLTVPNYFNLSPATLEFWFKANSWAGNSIIISKNSGGASNGYIQSTGTLKFYAPGNIPTVNWGNPSLNVWHHATLVITGTQHLAYLDGSIVGSPVSSALALFTGNYNFKIGCYDNGAYPFNGSVDQVKIYDYARTPAQIAYDYNKGGPVGWWKFDECQGNIAYDWSGIGNTGTIIIGASGTQNSLGTCSVGTSAAWTNGANGKLNSSLSFDGVDDYVNVGNIGTTLTSMTISLWSKTPTNNRLQTLVSKWGTSGGSRFSWLLFTNLWGADGHIDFLTSSTGTSYARAQTPSNTIIANKWQNIVGVYTGSSMYIYVDGVLKGTQNSGVPTSLRSVSTPLTIGADWDTGGVDDVLYRTFSGQIDDVRIYNYALTPTQIKTLYNGGAMNFN